MSRATAETVEMDVELKTLEGPGSKFLGNCRTVGERLFVRASDAKFHARSLEKTVRSVQPLLLPLMHRIHASSARLRLPMMVNLSPAPHRWHQEAHEVRRIALACAGLTFLPTASQGQAMAVLHVLFQLWKRPERTRPPNAQRHFTVTS